MSTSASVSIDLNDPRLTTIPIDETPYVDNPMARFLFENGLAERARRFDNCKVFGHMEKCRKGHRVKMVSYCGLRFCPVCAARAAKEMVKKWKTTLKLLVDIDPATRADGDHGKFTYLEIRQPSTRSSQAMEKLLDEAYDKIRDATWTRKITFGPMWRHGVGFDGTVAIVRILVLSEMKPEEWRVLWPDASVDVHIVPLYRLLWFFEHKLLEPWLPSAPEDCAEHEIMFSKVHLWRVSMVSCAEEDAEDLLVEDSSTTDKSDENPPGSHLHHVRTCRICGEPIIERTQSFNLHELPPPLEWRKV